MGDVVEEIVSNVLENITNSDNSTMTKRPSTPEGMAVAYGSLVIMSMFPIFFGSIRSVNHHREQKVVL